MSEGISTIYSQGYWTQAVGSRMRRGHVHVIPTYIRIWPMPMTSWTISSWSQLTSALMKVLLIYAVVCSTLAVTTRATLEAVYEASSTVLWELPYKAPQAFQNLVPKATRMCTSAARIQTNKALFTW